MGLINYLKTWWRVKQFNRAMIKLSKTATPEPEVYSVEGVRAWKESNWFGIRNDELDARCMSSVPPSPRVANIFKEIG